MHAPLNSNVMFTSALRGTFYALLTIQVALLCLAFSAEMTNKPAFLTETFATTGPWPYIFLGVWDAVFLVVVVAVVRAGGVSKGIAVLSLLLVMALAVVFAYLT